MAKQSTVDFLRAMNEANSAIAARLAEEEEAKVINTDPFRLASDRKRRERLGQLRAREHPGNRPVKVIQLFG